jgi:molybdate transport system regulatory protein
MTDNRLSIRIDLVNGDRIGPGKIALLEGIRATGSISGAARKLGILLPRLASGGADQRGAARAGGRGSGRQGGGAALTPTGEQLVALYRAIERAAPSSTSKQFRAVDKLIRKGTRASAGRG